MAKSKLTAAEYNDSKQQGIVDKIISAMDAGKKPWVKPWVGVPYMNPLTKAPYQGMNPIHLSIDVVCCGYTTPLFMGAVQAKTWGWHPAKGSKATWIKQGLTDRTDEDGKEVKRFFTRWVPVFNLDVLAEGDKAVHSLEEIKAQYCPNPGDQLGQLPLVEAFIAAQPVSTQFTGDRACYSPSSDRILMPDRSAFHTLTGFYATWLHEHGHSTGHKSRLDRDMTGQFGSRDYAYEELVAELCSTLTCEHLGISPDVENHASYLNGWLEKMKGDRSYFFSALKLAQAASRFMIQNFDAKGNSVPALSPSADKPVEMVV
jgi:antirestriction protein ArdC